MFNRTVADITTDRLITTVPLSSALLSIQGLSLATCAENNLLFQNRVDARPSN